MELIRPRAFSGKRYSMSRRTIAMIALLLVMGIWGSAFAVTKTAIAEIPPIMISLLRFVVASVILLPFVFIRRKRVAPVSRAALGWMAAMGFCGLTLFQSASNLALSYTTATQAALIQSIIPVMTALLAAFILRERLNLKQMLGIGLSLAGVVAVILIAAPNESARNPVLGGSIMAGSIGLWALYTILAKRLAHIDSLTVTTYSTLFGTLFLIPPTLIESWGNGLPTISIQGWLSILFLGVLSSAVANLVYNWSLVHLDASQAATFINLVPIIGVVVAALFLGEPLIVWQIAGGALALVGVWLAT